MGVSLKTENEECSGMIMQIRGSKADQRRPLAGGALRLSSPCEPSVVIPGSPSARLNRCLKPDTGHWLLRFSVLRETPVTSTLNILIQKAKMLGVDELAKRRQSLYLNFLSNSFLHATPSSFSMPMGEEPSITPITPLPCSDWARTTCRGFAVAQKM
jgi:hypothetical protein